jgi:hypothetical protein
LIVSIFECFLTHANGSSLVDRDFPTLVGVREGEGLLWGTVPVQGQSLLFVFKGDVGFGSQDFGVLVLLHHLKFRAYTGNHTKGLIFPMLIREQSLSV